MNRFADLVTSLKSSPKKWGVTGAAGFIGSHLAQKLLELNQEVVGIDNFATGKRENIELLKNEKFRFVESNINDVQRLKKEFMGLDYVLHQAALGSVPRSIENPVASNEANVSGSLAVLSSAKDSGVKRVVYASSSSIYGDRAANSDRAMSEDQMGRPLSPYAATKQINELYAEVFRRNYNLSTVGLRYFNVFGPRQDPEGAYAAVIPKWIGSLMRGERCFINGDGLTSRDFCYIDNVVQANILAATFIEAAGSSNFVFNIACGDRTDLRTLYETIRKLVETPLQAEQREARAGDIKHSFADISLAQKILGYQPEVFIEEGLKKTVSWFKEHSG